VAFAAFPESPGEIRNPAPYFFAGYPDCIPAAELQSLTLISNGAPLAGDAPEVPIGKQIDIALQLVPRVTASHNLRLRVGIGNDYGTVSDIFLLDFSQWEVGVAYTQRCVMRVPPFTVVGNGTLTVAIQEDRPADDDSTASKVRVSEAVLFRMPVRAMPVTVESNITDSEVANTFGNEMSRIAKAFRIAPGQHVTLAVPELNRPVIGVALIAATWKNDPTNGDEPILRISARTGAQSQSTFTTSSEGAILANYDAYRPGAREREHAHVFTTYPHPGQSWKGERLRANTYICEVALAPQHPDLILVQNVGTAATDVYDIVLLHPERVKDGG
jgi:hypothetical protein